MPTITLSSPLASTCSTIVLVGEHRDHHVGNGGKLAQAVRRIAADLLHEVVGDLTPRITCTVNPAFTRQEAIGQPMLPTPTKPTPGPSGISRCPSRRPRP
jgi:hypothetical protein